MRSRSASQRREGICSQTLKSSTRGFTLMELLLVLVVIAMLAAVGAPVVSQSIQRSRESTLKETLFVLRKAIDDYYADTRDYPPDLETLIEKRYLRRLPLDPLTDRYDTWILVRAESVRRDQPGGIIDVKSGATGASEDGGPYRDW